MHCFGISSNLRVNAFPYLCISNNVGCFTRIKCYIILLFQRERLKIKRFERQIVARKEKLKKQRAKDRLNASKASNNEGELKTVKVKPPTERIIPEEEGEGSNQNDGVDMDKSREGHEEEEVISSHSMFNS